MTRVLQETYYSTAGWPTMKIAVLLRAGVGKSRLVQHLLAAHLLPPLMQAAQEPSRPAGTTQHPSQAAQVLLPE